MPYSEKISQGEWRSEWINMPEFEISDMRPARSITVHFTCDEDVEKFAKLLNTKITPKQKFYWFSKREPKTGNDMVYVDEEEDN